MSTHLDALTALLDAKAKGAIKGTAKLVITDQGTVLLSETGAAPSDADAEADVTLKASEAVFRAILDGSQNPITAVMTGKLKVDGNQMRALKVSEVLTT
ncbi:SCP2 sterol-binding domain-containing protein [Litoreibacter albidus]|uniref:SCP-2 sterol transfer family protein n=1 Tax=Litoreibacter albidus TaxID=670155 RepID=A0A1H3BA47_9RHOB|nr:SCP2 sterol-binding domain-containing protein [Litoreibacter albidus]SDX38665.1 SCP-2 sterol transfer family protein [Litoreibacter albidus]